MPSEVESLAKNAIESQVLGIELVFCEISYKFPIYLAESYSKSRLRSVIIKVTLLPQEFEERFQQNMSGVCL